MQPYNTGSALLYHLTWTFSLKYAKGCIKFQSRYPVLLLVVNSGVCLLGHLAARAVINISSIFQKSPILRIFFLYFHEQNKYEIQISVHCSVCTIKLTYMKMRKLLTLALNYIFEVEIGQK